ncbi:accessory Sec system protein Asp3 [Vagococcus lutrae]|uniref:accessory Sec system protein Asp3 n=1 Tax=Enterococcaceae TaxID=81852 RepID=UPI00288F7832|nr:MULTISPECIES: accessory Sec system protein Asp3 [Enterococcaceae]MDT2463444.1 accessory Sec system protein Asp3 [Enterococcus avium]MDT2806867.1 accessory Sec system protein Asp3 [Vagococcus lutrae]MDT2808498.1 accessory Sec system protein Asp3 [Vagococcus lutrae]MDT2818072.1 accessory Sec system protein Asp3 [Vagococcus lutrae]
MFNWKPINIIKWGQLRQEDFLYGSQIRYSTDSELLYWENTLMPSGKVIHEWSSRVHYQETREPIQLPTLIPGNHYALQAVVSNNSEGKLKIKIAFYNYHHNLIQEIFFDLNQIEFSIPSQCLFYKVTLINAGLDNFIFRELVLYEEDKKIQTLVNAKLWRNTLQHIDLNKDVLNIQITGREPVTGRVITEIEDSRFSDQAISLLTTAIKYRETCITKEIKEIVKEFPSLELVNLLFVEKKNINIWQIVKDLKEEGITPNLYSLTNGQADRDDLILPLYKRTYMPLDIGKGC